MTGRGLLAVGLLLLSTLDTNSSYLHLLSGLVPLAPGRRSKVADAQLPDAVA